MKKERVLSWTALVTVWIVWGSTYLGISVAVETIPPFLMAGVRFLLAGLLMFAVVGPRHARGAQRLTWPHLRSAVIIGGLMLVGGNGLLSAGEQHLDSGLAALVVATVPVWMVLINALVTRTRIPAALVAALLLGTVGIGVLVGGPGGEVHTGSVVVVVIASALWAAGSVYARSAPLPSHPMVVSATEMIAAGVMLLILGVLRGEPARLRLSEVSAASLAGLAWLVFAGSIVAFTAYMYANSTLSNHTVATYAYVNPVIAVVLGVALGDETIGANVYLGGAIIVSAVVLIVTGRSSDRRTEPKAEPDPADRRAGPEPRPGAVARGPASSARPSAGTPGDTAAP
ncbi:EamA family transporter [Streptomyces leeuwenhoekii]|jgi:drug/metabolite transporter (DMT)-like permease|uniref:EamA family transporter n=1 Tax=Streptomyces leeuwenhoekii TaxID=1437453 RepID=UPI00367CFEE0